MLVSMHNDRYEFNFIYSSTCIYLMFPEPFAKDAFCLPVYVFDNCQILIIDVMYANVQVFNFVPYISF